MGRFISVGMYGITGRSQMRTVLGLGLMLGASFAVQAHAILVKSNPKANGVVEGPQITVELTFNSRVDRARSQVVVVGTDHARRKLSFDRVETTDRLTGKLSDLKPGNYQLEWQVLAVDGHISRGSLPFTVK